MSIRCAKCDSRELSPTDDTAITEEKQPQRHRDTEALDAGGLQRSPPGAAAARRRLERCVVRCSSPWPCVSVAYQPRVPPRPPWFLFRKSLLHRLHILISAAGEVHQNIGGGTQLLRKLA